MAFLTPQEIEKQQSESEGYQQGPQPEINNPNANTQFNLGNPQVQTPEPAPYYPGATETPILNLSLTNMGVNVAENFILLDNGFGINNQIAVYKGVSGAIQTLRLPYSITAADIALGFAFVTMPFPFVWPD